MTGLTLQAFGKSIGVGKSLISMIENETKPATG